MGVIQMFYVEFADCQAVAQDCLTWSPSVMMAIPDDHAALQKYLVSKKSRSVSFVRPVAST